MNPGEHKDIGVKEEHPFRGRGIQGNMAKNRQGYQTPAENLPQELVRCDKMGHRGRISIIEFDHRDSGPVLQQEDISKFAENFQVGFQSGAVHQPGKKAVACI